MVCKNPRLQAAPATHRSIAPAPVAFGRRRAVPASSIRLQATGMAALVLALHAIALYVIARAPQATPAQPSVPLTVSFATAAEPTTPAKSATPKTALTEPKSPPVKSRTALTPRAVSAIQETAPAPDTTPTPATAPTEAPAPPLVSAARFDVAYLNNPAPAYPALSRRLSEEGRVLLRVFVTADGRAQEVRLEGSSGYARLDSAAQDAVARWRFVPARRGDDTVATWVLVPISFSLKQG